MQAHAHQWQEECLLLQEEMRRVITFFSWQAKHWKEITQNHADKLLSATVEVVAIADVTAWDRIHERKVAYYMPISRCPSMTISLWEEVAQCMFKAGKHGWHCSYQYDWMSLIFGKKFTAERLQRLIVYIVYLNGFNCWWYMEMSIEDWWTIVDYGLHTHIMMNG